MNSSNETAAPQDHIYGNELADESFALGNKTYWTRRRKKKKKKHHKISGKHFYQAQNPSYIQSS
jgi:hypothetical protein